MLNTITNKKTNVKSRPVPIIRGFFSGKTKFLLVAALALFNSAQAQWQQTNLNVGTVLSLATKGTELFAGGYSGGVLMSSDNGVNWAWRNTGLPGSNQVDVLSFMGNNLFAGMGGGTAYLYVSNDDGLSWTEKGAGMFYNDIRCITVSDNTIFVGDFDMGTVYMSSDTGNTWTESYLIGNPWMITVTDILINGNEWYVGTEWGDVYLSTDTGAIWKTVNFGLPGSYVQKLTMAGGRLFASFYGAGVFSLNDTTWSAVNNGLTNKKIISFISNGNNLFAGTDSGVFLSTDTGANWKTVDTGLPKEAVRSLAIIGDTIFAGTTTQGLWKREACQMMSTAYSQNINFCFGQSVIVGSNTYDTTGTYIDTLMAFNGCDSIVTTTITIYYIPASTITQNGNTLTCDTTASIYQWYLNGAPINASDTKIYTATQSGFYKVEITDATNCKSMSDSINVIINGINDLNGNSKTSVSIYPNPFTHSTTIEISYFQSAICNLEIYDVLGQKIHQQTLNSILTMLNLNLPSGIYFYKLKNEKEIIANGKMVVSEN